MKHAKLRLKHNRKGLSPLVATVLLIAFAVALGAVVMNWGKQQVETHIEEGEACKQVSLNWYLSDGKEQICYTSSKFSFTIENSEKIEVNDLKLIVIGSQDIYTKQNLRIGLRKSDLKKTEVDYDLAKYGEPQEIRLIPIIDVDEEEIICSASHALIKKKPSKCASQT